MKQHRIALITRSIPSHRTGGMEYVGWDLATELVRQGVDVSVLTTRLDMPSPVANVDGVNVIAVQEARPGQYSPGWWTGSVKYFKRYLAKWVTGVLSISAGGYAVVRHKDALGIHVPFVMQAHGTSRAEVRSKLRSQDIRQLLTIPRNAAWYVVDSVMYRRFDAIVAVGKRVYEDLRHWPGLHEKLVLINNGVDGRTFAPDQFARHKTRSLHGWGAKDFIVITVARLHPQKGVHYSLRGFARFARMIPEARYLIVGDGPARAGLETLAVELGIGDKVQFAGAVSRCAVADLLNAADVFLLTTVHQEGLPLDILEALSVGVPVIVSRHIVDGHDWSGTIAVDPRDELEVAQALTSAYRHQPASRMSTLPREFSLEFMAQQYVELFEKLKR